VSLIRILIRPITSYNDQGGNLTERHNETECGFSSE
jgi:hypothetical protein